MSATHTATLLVHDRMTGETAARTIEVRVLDTRIVDDQGRSYDKSMTGSQIAGRFPTGYVRRIDLASLKPIQRPRLRL